VTPSEHEIDLAASPERALAALARAADLWGAEYEPGAGGGRLRLAVAAGLRRGWAGGEVSVEPLPEGSRLRLRVDEGKTFLHAPRVAVLALGAVGGLAVVAWPFWPALLPLAPLGAVLALAAWFLVSSRLRASGPGEFLDVVAAEVGQEAESRGAAGGLYS
jgi:hypothetical protein